MNAGPDIIRIASISDEHQEKVPIPDALVAFKPHLVLRAGDMCATEYPNAPGDKHDPHIDEHIVAMQRAFLENGLQPDLEELALKLNLEPEDIIATGGNHDRVFEVAEHRARQLPMTLLLNEQVTRHGITIWGSPFTPTFNGWSFMAADESLAALWQDIPADVDIVLVHGPPYGTCDTTGEGRMHLGSQSLRLALRDRGVPLLVCGHIHPGRGAERLPVDDTLVVNCAALDNDYMLRDKPWMLLEYNRVTRRAEWVGEA